jgi:hypothetical protein
MRLSLPRLVEPLAIDISTVYKVCMSATVADRTTSVVLRTAGLRKSGKTTTIRILLGLFLRHYSAERTVAGAPR